MQLKRITISVKDITHLNGRSERTARSILSAIRLKHKKQKHHAVTIGELCEHLGISKEEAIEALELKIDIKENHDH